MLRIVILGPDGCGKDTLARILTDLSPLRYPEPTSLTWARYIPEWQDGRDIVDWWMKRRQHRDEWIDAANRLMARQGVTAIADRVFGVADIYTGLRHQDELSAVLQRCTPNMVVWCWNPSLKTHYGTSLTPELSADMTWGLNVHWCLAQPTVLGGERVASMLGVFIKPARR